MALPQQIKVGPLTYKIEVTDDFDVPDGTAKDYFGLTDHTFETIFIHSEQSELHGAIIAVHEALHAILHQTGIMNAKREERFVRELTFGLFSFIRDNPEFIEHLQGVSDANV